MQGHPGACCTVRSAMSGLAERTFQTPAMRASHFYRWRASALLYGCDLEIKSCTPTLFCLCIFKYKAVQYSRAHAHMHSLTHASRKETGGWNVQYLLCRYASKQRPLGKVNSLLAQAVMTVGYYAEDSLMMPCVAWQKVSTEEGQACAFFLPAQFLFGGHRRILIWWSS